MISSNLWLNQVVLRRSKFNFENKELVAAESNQKALSNYFNLNTSEKLRIVFIGQALYFRQAALEGKFLDAECFFLSYTNGSNPMTTIDLIQSISPHITIIFRPEMCMDLEPALKNSFTIGYFTEPLPNNDGLQNNDLDLRFEFLKQSGLEKSRNYNLFIGFNPYFSNSLESLFHIWQYFPIPVNDSIYVDSINLGIDVNTGIFVGRTTKYRSSFLNTLQHRYNWTVLESAHLVDLSPYSIALNLHNEPYPNFENRILLHMALGQLVLTENIHPKLDLINGYSHLEFHSLNNMLDILNLIPKNLEMFESIRIAGLNHSKRYSASRVWGNLLSDVAMLLGSK